MYCIMCGKPINDGKKYCEECEKVNSQLAKEKVKTEDSMDDETIKNEIETLKMQYEKLISLREEKAADLQKEIDSEIGKNNERKQQLQQLATAKNKVSVPSDQEGNSSQIWFCSNCGRKMLRGNFCEKCGTPRSKEGDR